MLSFIAYVMDSPETDTIDLALNTLEIFVKNVENYTHVTSTYGIQEALDALINKYSIDNPKLSKRAQLIKDNIERMKPPIYNLRSRCRRVIEPKKLKTHVIILHVHGLLPVSKVDQLIQKKLFSDILIKFERFGEHSLILGMFYLYSTQCLVFFLQKT